MRKRNLIIVAIILMAVGFAVVTTNLIINGNVAVSNNKDDYDIKFTRVLLDSVENNSLIGNNGKEISYQTKQLTNIGDTSKLEYEITNNSSQYDAEVTISCSPTGEITHTELYTINTTNTPSIIRSKTTETGSIEIVLNEISAESIKENFKCTLNINALERTSVGNPIYKEEILNGTDPVIKSGLIPVTLSSTGEVTYADTQEEWYNYENKEWANAVILTDNAKVYNVGEKIEESDIESYFVWIPRYRYQLFHTEQEDGLSERLSESNAQTIEIEFESEDVKPSTGANDGEWLTHPAFTNFNTNGIWVGKFETGYKGATTKESAQVNNSDSLNIIVKPNTYSWRNNTVSNMFMASYNYKRNLNSHMMKNTEWGAVAYLSHSIYGINDEVRINNNSNYLTGYAANTKDGEPSTTDNQAYNTETGYLASTAGNITGVYDMSGGAWEYMAAYRDNTFGSSGLTSTEISEVYKEYFDIYSSESNRVTYSKRILGDATGEIGPFFNDGSNNKNNWYSDYADFIDSSYPWILRGCDNTCQKSAGQFSLNRDTGNGFNYNSMRLVLVF